VSEPEARIAPNAGDDDADEPPPILGRWSRLYALVVLELFAIIAALLWLTRRFD
jgi:hypothetical protein